MNPPTWRRLPITGLALAGLLQAAGCSTTYQRAEHEVAPVRQAVAQAVPTPPLPRALCVRRALQARGADPSRLTIYTASISNAALPPNAMSGHTPQLEYSVQVQAVLTHMGFRVPFSASEALGNASLGRYIVQASLVSFAPMTRSTSGNDALDLQILGAERERVVARGSVGATANLFAADGQTYVSWGTAQSEAVFYQVKDKRHFNVAMTNGWLTAGTGGESTEVGAVQHASLLAVQDAVISAISGALRLGC